MATGHYSNRLVVLGSGAGFSPSVAFCSFRVVLDGYIHSQEWRPNIIYTIDGDGRGGFSHCVAFYGICVVVAGYIRSSE